VHFQNDGRIASIGQDRQSAQTGHGLAQEFETLASNMVCWSDRPVMFPPGRARLVTRPADRVGRRATWPHYPYFADHGFPV